MWYLQSQQDRELAREHKKERIIPNRSLQILTKCHEEHGDQKAFDKLSLGIWEDFPEKNAISSDPYDKLDKTEKMAGRHVELGLLQGLHKLERIFRAISFQSP